MSTMLLTDRRNGRINIRRSSVELNSCHVMCVNVVYLSTHTRFSFTKYQPTTVTTVCRQFCHRTRKTTCGGPWPSSDPNISRERRRVACQELMPGFDERCQLASLKPWFMIALHPSKIYIPYFEFPRLCTSFDSLRKREQITTVG